MSKKKRVQIFLSRDLLKIIEKETKIFGDTDAEKCVGIIKAYLSEKNLLK